MRCQGVWQKGQGHCVFSYYPKQRDEICRAGWSLPARRLDCVTRRVFFGALVFASAPYKWPISDNAMTLGKGKEIAGFLWCGVRGAERMRVSVAGEGILLE